MSVKFNKLFSTPTTVVIETDGIHPYSSEEVTISVNGSVYSRSCKNVNLLSGLPSDSEVEISVSGGGHEFSRVFFMQNESVCLNAESFGASGDGKTVNTAALQAAIMSCPVNGRLVIPPGVFLTGPLFLKSGMVLELEEGSVLKAVEGRENYPVLPGFADTAENSGGRFYLGTWEGEPETMYASLINIISAKNTVITGKGKIDGSGSEGGWWADPKRKKDAWRPRTVFINSSSDVTVQGVTVMNSPSWTIHPFRSENIRIYDVTVLNPKDSPNTDGINPESCINVDIIGVKIHVGDDCIAVKSGKISTVKDHFLPSENIKIRNCLLEAGHGAVVLGSELASGIYNLSVSQCRFKGTDRGLRIKTRRGRGSAAVVDNIIFRNIEMDGVGTPIVINSFYHCDLDGKTQYVQSEEALPVDENTPSIGKVEFKNLTCSGVKYAAAVIYGLPEKKIGSISIDGMQISFDTECEAGFAAMRENIDKMKNEGFVLQNIENVMLVNINFHDGPAHFKISDCNNVSGIDDKVMSADKI